MNGMHGIIFSYDKENGLRELIENRVHGSIPFGGDYRIIDFILSSMVNAGVTDVGVIMHGKCQSLLDHLGSGKSWDLSRNFGGLTLLPAFAYNEQHRGDGQFRGRVDALGSVMNYLKSIRQDYVVLSDSDTVINAPLEDVLHRHIDTGADITAVCTAVPGDGQDTYFRLDARGRITDTAYGLHTPEGYRCLEDLQFLRGQLIKNAKIHGFGTAICLFCALIAGRLWVILLALLVGMHNLYCVLVQRMNLLRLDRLLQRRAAKENGAFYPTTKQQLRYS